MDFDTLKALDAQYVMPTYARFPLAIERGLGAMLYDFEGRDYVDFTSGIGVGAIGYSNPGWIAAVEKQIKKLSHVSNLFYTEPGTLLAQKLCTQSGMGKAFFCNSGAESNEGAIKLARKYSFDKYGPGRSTVITLLNSFHGRTVTTLSATGQDKFHHSFFPFTEGFRFVPANDLAALKESAGQDVCAVMLELIQGEGGVVPLDADYVRAVRRLCDENDWLFLCDEVQTGIGRTGSLFAFQQYDLLPDVVSCAKGLAGGLPLGAVLAAKKCADTLGPGAHATTFGANPVCCAAALEVLSQMEEIIPQVTKKGETLRRAIENMGAPFVRGTRGLGLMIGVPLSGLSPAELNGRLLKAGVLCLTAGSDTLRLLPPLTITEEEIDLGLSRMKTVFTEVTS